MSIENLSDNSVLALAAYADNLTRGPTSLDHNNDELRAAGLTDDQITRFEQQWPDVVDIADPIPTSLGATVFRNGRSKGSE